MCAQVDDLKDIGALEEYIQRSQVILFFLSQGYFRSKARLPPPTLSALCRTLSPRLPPRPRHRTASARSARRSRRTSRSSSSKKRTLTRAAGRCRRCATSAPRTCSRTSLTRAGRTRSGIASRSFSASRSRSSPRRRRPQPAASSPLLPDHPHLNHRRCSSARPTIWTRPPSRSACRASPRASRSPFPNRARSGPRRPTRARRSWPTSSPPPLPASPSPPPRIGRPRDAHAALPQRGQLVSDERLAEQVKQAREDRLKIVMAHENDPDLGGCQFSRFFEVTPQERVSSGAMSRHPSLPPPSTLQRRRSSSPADSTRTWQNRASRGAPPQGARSVSPTARSPRIERFVTRGGPCPQVSLVASGKEPRRDPRSVGQRRQHEPPLGQHRQAWQPARSHDQPPQLCDDNHRGRRLWRRGDGLGGLGGVGGLGGGGAGACLTWRPHSRQTPQHTDAILSNSHEQAPATRGAGEEGWEALAASAIPTGLGPYPPRALAVMGLSRSGVLRGAPSLERREAWLGGRSWGGGMMHS